jgi:hypothetical protein
VYLEGCPQVCLLAHMAGLKQENFPGDRISPPKCSCQGQISPLISYELKTSKHRRPNKLERPGKIVDGMF